MAIMLQVCSYVALLLVFLISLVLADTSDNEQGCDNEDIVCQNDGVYTDDCPSHMRKVDLKLSAQFSCDCPPGFHGVECELMDEGVCNSTEADIAPYFDDYPENPDEDKYWECFLRDADVSFFGFKDHRVSVRGQLPKMELELKARLNNGSIPDSPRWMPIMTIFTCELNECTAEAIPDDPEYQLYYTCDFADCKACPGDPQCGSDGPCCSTLLTGLINTLKAPVDFKVKDIHKANQNSEMYASKTSPNPDVEFFSSSFPPQTPIDLVSLGIDLAPGQDPASLFFTQYVPPVADNDGPQLQTSPTYGAATEFTVDIKTQILSFVDVTCYTGRCLDSPNEVEFQQYDDYAWVTLWAVCGSMGLIFLVSFAALCTIRPAKASEFEALKQKIRENGGGINAPLMTYGDEKSDRSTMTGRETMYELVWQNVSYTVPTPTKCCGGSTASKRRTILQGMNGHIESGKIMGILGASGAGKTTLLDILGGRPKVGKVSGLVSLFEDQQQVVSRSLSQHINFVPTEDCLLDTQTVFEALMFSARLRLPGSLSLDTIKLKVMTLLFDLGLAHVAHNLIGSNLNGGGGISTGERKRVHLGMELVTDPRVLVMDEATSGLDSYNAGVLMEVLHRAAVRDNVLCIMSIHQPPFQVYRCLDTVLVMGYSGQCAYFGPGANVIPYLNNIGFDCPPGQTAAEFILEMTSNRDDTRLQELTEAYDGSFDQKKMQGHIDHLVQGKPGRYEYDEKDIHADANNNEEKEDGNNYHRTSFNFVDVLDVEEQLAQGQGSHLPSLNVYIDSVEALDVELPKLERANGASFFTQLLLLTSRSFIHMARKPTLLFLTLFIAIIAGAFLALLFYGLDNEMAGSQSRAGFLFFIIFFFALTSLSSLAQYAQDRRLYLYETNVHMYGSAAYILSKIPSDILPLRMLPPLILGCIVYYPIGLQDDPFKFINFLMIIVLVNLVASSACFVIATLVHDLGTANLVAVCYFVFSMLFGGLFLAEDSVAGGVDEFNWLQLFKYGSFFHFGYEALMTNEFVGLDLTFDLDDVSSVNYDGSYFLDLFSIQPEYYGEDVMALGLMAISLLVIGFACLKFVNSIKR